MTAFCAVVQSAVVCELLLDEDDEDSEELEAHSAALPLDEESTGTVQAANAKSAIMATPLDKNFFFINYLPGKNSTFKIVHIMRAQEKNFLSGNNNP